MITTETTPVINDDNNTITTLSEVDNKADNTLLNPDNMITEADNKPANVLSNPDNTLTKSDNMITDSDNKVDNVITKSDNTLADSDNIDNTIPTVDNKRDNNDNDWNNSLNNHWDTYGNTPVTPDNTVLQDVSNNDNTVITSDNMADNIDNTPVNADNTVITSDNKFDNIDGKPDNIDVSKLEKFYGIRLKGTSVHKIETLSAATGVKPTNYVTSLIEAQLSETIPTIDLDKLRADERQKCAAQQAELMKLFMPITTHESEIRNHEAKVKTLETNLALQDEKYTLLYKEATRLFQELARANQEKLKIPENVGVFPKSEIQETEVINLNQFQEIMGVLSKIIVNNRYVPMTQLFNLALNLFNQTTTQKS